ncbi:MAG TPA: TetR/AcrR family transcriptional regulator [Mycobacterium sp.]|nr:TetR/AcrR family transcriptional regulator [Mycobacterium sp.]HQE16485.1 TetR/AcrR family transcriptional regulator [Mycobacterium sp.]
MSDVARRGPGRPPAAKSANTRARILDTAREVFGEVGYDAATFQEIAVRADLTRPAVNHHFSSKRELYRQVAAQTNSMIIEAGVREAHKRRGFADQMDAFMATVQAEGKDPAVAAFLVTSVLEAQRHPELVGNGDDVLAGTRRFVGNALREAQLAGELRPDVDIEAVTETLLAMLIGVGFYAGFCVGPRGSGRRVSAVTGEFMKMLRGTGLLSSD